MSKAKLPFPLQMCPVGGYLFPQEVVEDYSNQYLRH